MSVRTLFSTAPVRGWRGAARNAAEPSGREDRSTVAPGGDNATVRSLIDNSPLPNALKRELPQVIAARVLALLAHVAESDGKFGK